MDDLLSAAAVRSRPIAMAGTRKLEVGGALRGLFPDGGIQRGITVGVGSAAGVPGSVSLALAVAGGAMTGGSCTWTAAVGFPSLGLVAAVEMGVAIERFALVPAPGESWPVVTASLLDGVDLVMLRPPPRVRSSDARRIAARVRERGAVLMVVETEGKQRWPESVDVRLDVKSASWVGLGVGHGNLRTRRAEVLVGGRRMAGGRSRTVALWLPGPDGGVEEAFPEGGVPAESASIQGSKEPVGVQPVISVAG